MFDFKQYIAERRETVEKRLEEYLSEGQPEILFEAMRYSVLGGGKRFRAILCMAGAEAIYKYDGLYPSDIHQIILPCACAIELIHAMSLVHDDLPCLDNDDYRRGKLTNHKVFGEAMALLAGDALLMLAQEILIEKTRAAAKTIDWDVDLERLLAVALELARASGASGMVGGQVEDLIAGGAPGATISSGKSADTKKVASVSSVYSDTASDALTLEKIHRKKTGALLRFSIWSGACLAGATQHQLKVLSHFGEILGIAFQIADDLLDVTGDINTLGKTPGKDEAQKKLTWVRLYGIEESRKRLIQLERKGIALLSETGLNGSSNEALEALLQYAIHRQN